MMNNFRVRVLKAVSTAAVFGLPMTVLAANPDTGYFENLALGFGRVINYLIPAFLGLALLYFFYGVITYVIKAGDDEARKGARHTIVYGLIGMLIISAVWGFVALGMDLLGIENVPGNTITPPTIE